MSEGPRAARIFTLEDANALLPAVRQITDDAVRAADALTGQLHPSAAAQEAQSELEAALNEIVARWAREIEALGVEPKGLWLVDFDTGEGYYCWKHPEPAITHYHGYADGFAGRMKIV